MTHDVWVGDIAYPTDLVVFDKDGTLIDFTGLWHGLAVQATENLLTQCNLDKANARQIYAVLGFDPVARSTDADGALAVGPNDRIYRLVEQQLRSLGQNPEQAARNVHEVFMPVLEAPPDESLLVQTGDVRAVFSRLKAVGIKVAVATTDIHSSTAATLSLLGVSEMLDDLICADDSVRVTKPDPRALLNLADDLGVQAEHVMMVGDTVGDMRMARQTGACVGVAVLTGAGTREQLSGWSDVVIDGIDQIRTQPC